MIQNSILLYHNGNQRVIDRFKKHFRFHSYQGNWSEHLSHPLDNSLYEICIADATDANLSQARFLGIRILRYISAYDDDWINPISEMTCQPYELWLSNVVCKNLSFADIVDCEFFLNNRPKSQHSVIITTGRTANTHLQMIDKSAMLVEGSKIIDEKLLEAKEAIFLWRLDQWDCLVSSWLLQINNNVPLHQFNSKLRGSVPPTVNLDSRWIDNQWKNLCQFVMDSAMFFRYVIKRPISHMTTEDIVKRFKSPSEKINYSKSDLVLNYEEMHAYYQSSTTRQILTMCYNNLHKHII
jgi:hypothetical protein